ncbi:hypothetical protein HKX48_003915 [Thoreauomyces humboldtii]|nr:hypothetical protein HKX48_003915 [Thoreauomyces humboldtii]
MYATPSSTNGPSTPLPPPSYTTSYSASGLSAGSHSDPPLNDPSAYATEDHQHHHDEDFSSQSLADESTNKHLSYASGDALFPGASSGESSTTLQGPDTDSGAVFGYPSGKAAGVASSLLGTLETIRSPRSGQRSPIGSKPSTINYNPLVDEKHGDDDGFGPPMGSHGKRERTCRCCCTRLRCRPVCFLGFIVLALILIAVFGTGFYFLFAQIPTVDVSSPYIPATSDAALFRTSSSSKYWVPGLAHTGSITAATAAAPFHLAIGVGVNCTVTSVNHAGYRVNSLTVSGQLKDVNGNVLNDTIANALTATSEVEDIDIAPRSSTLIRLPVSINYTLDTPMSVVSLITDPVMAVLVAACGIPNVQPATAGARIRMKVTTVVDLRIISWTGYKPKIVKDVMFACPSTMASALADIFQSKTAASTSGATATAAAVSSGGSSGAARPSGVGSGSAVAAPAAAAAGPTETSTGDAGDTGDN